jgi:hypothetical protein
MVDALLAQKQSDESSMDYTQRFPLVAQDLRNIFIRDSAGVRGSREYDCAESAGKADFNSTSRKSFAQYEVLVRLTDAFDMPDDAGPSLGRTNFFDLGREDDEVMGFAAEVLAGTVCDDHGVSLRGGYEIGPIPTHNRESDGPLDDPSKWHDAALDAEGTRLIRENEPPVVREPDPEAVIKTQRSKVMTAIRHDPSLWGRICIERERLGASYAADWNAELRATEALDWIVVKEVDRDFEEARQLTLFFFQTRMSQRKFCSRFGVGRTMLQREIDKYAAAIVARLRGRRPIAPDIRVRPNPSLIRGIPALALVMNRTVKQTLRKIDSGKAPIATLVGEPVALRELLKPHRLKSKIRRRAKLKLVVSNDSPKRPAINSDGEARLAA